MNNESLNVAVRIKAEDASKAIKNAKEETKDFKKSISALRSDIEKTFKTSGIVAWGKIIKDSINFMVKASQKQADYAESVNLLKVAFKDTSDEAQELLSNISDLTGFDPSTLTKYLGTFRQMSSALGITSEYADTLSKNLVQMQLDLSSLYNMDLDTVGKKLQSAMAGQRTAIRAFGAEITEATLEVERQNMGISKSVEEMTRAEKTILIYLALEKQLINANGDVSRTINSVANQMKIFTNQTSIAGRQLGSIFIKVLQSLLPVINGVLMAFNHLTSSLMTLLGVDAETLGGQFVSNELTNSFDDLSSSIEETEKASEKAKKSLVGWNKLNVITTPTDSGAGAGGSLGIDPELLALIKDYNLHLDDMNNLAYQYKEKILEWLEVFAPLEDVISRIGGLTFDGLVYVWENILVPMGNWAKDSFLPALIDSIASALEFVYQTALSLKPVLKWIFENIVKPFARPLGNTIVDILEFIGDLFDFLSRHKFFSTLGAGVTTMWGLYEVGKLILKSKFGQEIGAWAGFFADAYKETGSFKGALKETYNMMGANHKTVLKGMTETEAKAIKVKNKFNDAKAVLGGLIQTGIGLASMSSALEDMSENGVNFGNAIYLAIGFVTTLTGVLTVLKAGMDLFNASCNTNLLLLAVTGGVVLVAGIISLFQSFNEETRKADEELKKYNESLEEHKEKLKEIEDSFETSIENYQISAEVVADAKDKLAELVDENGRVIGSNEDVEAVLKLVNDQLGTQYEITDGQITLDGKLIETKEDLNSTMDKIVENLKKEAYYELARETYKENLRRQLEVKRQQNELQKELAEELAKYNEEEHGGYEQFFEDNKGKIEKLNDLEKEYEENGKKGENYFKAITEANNGNYDTAMKLLTSTVDTSKISMEDTVRTFLNSESAMVNKIGDKIKNLDGFVATATVTLNAKVDSKKLKEAEKQFQQTVQRGFMFEGGNPIYFKADGGFVDDGEMFIAREAGPELVGRIGNKTAVANNDQIVDSVSSGVARALSGIDFGRNVNIIAKGDTEGLLDFITFKQMEKDRQFGF